MLAIRKSSRLLQIIKNSIQQSVKILKTLVTHWRIRSEALFGIGVHYRRLYRPYGSHYSISSYGQWRSRNPASASWRNDDGSKVLIERQQDQFSSSATVVVDQLVTAKTKHQMAKMIVKNAIPEAGVRRPDDNG
jgi:hypothetical protein